MFLVVRPGAPSSVLAPSSDALVTDSFAVRSFKMKSRTKSRRGGGHRYEVEAIASRFVRLKVIIALR